MKGCAFRQQSVFICFCHSYKYECIISQTTLIDSYACKIVNCTRIENYSTRRTRHTHHRSKFHAAKHRLRTQNITSNFSEALLYSL